MINFKFQVGNKVRVLSKSKIRQKNSLLYITFPSFIKRMEYYTNKIGTIQQRVYSNAFNTRCYILKECSNVKWHEEWLEIYMENFLSTEDFSV